MLCTKRLVLATSTDQPAVFDDPLITNSSRRLVWTIDVYPEEGSVAETRSSTLLIVFNDFSPAD